ncbi:hypothetical protein V9T40_003493 [Parthenolecanium corni]|uniref:Secreted protein n=1 Tax=Parthenolecanium corni TaxID=536013 RepID=A0AAN9U152_9HEMI
MLLAYLCAAWGLIGSTDLRIHQPARPIGHPPRGGYSVVPPSDEEPVQEVRRIDYMSPHQWTTLAGLVRQICIVDDLTTTSVYVLCTSSAA